MFAAAVGLGGSTVSPRAEVLLATNFDGRTLKTVTSNNDTATGLTWTVNGFADPGDLTAVPDSPFGNGFGQFEANGLFETPSAADAFVPDLNIHNEGTYYVDVPLNPTGAVTLDGVSLTARIHNNGGIPQGVGRELDITVAVLDSAGNVIAEDLQSGQEAIAHNGDPAPTTVEFDLGGVPLASGTNNRLRIFFGADGTLVGNNAGFDDLEITGSAGPGGPGFLINSIEPDFQEQTVTLMWNSLPGRVYAVETSTDLVEWTELTDDVDSEGTTTEFVDQNSPLDPGRFYRVLVVE
jgi:hypothetical protein